MIDVLLFASLLAQPEGEPPPQPLPSREEAQLRVPAERPPGREPYPFLVSVSYKAGFPVNGPAFGVAIRERWHIEAGAGMGLPFVLSFGATAAVRRGFAVGRIATLAPGVVFNGFASRFCSAGGCGEPHHFMGVGPNMAVHLYVPSIRRFWLGIGGGGGVTFAVSRQRMRVVQPHVQFLSVTAGLGRRRRR